MKREVPSRLKYTKKISPELASTISGFVSGEGCFYRYCQKKGREYFCFSIENSIKDKSWYDLVKKTLGCGRMYERKRTSAFDGVSLHHTIILQVRAQEDIEKIIIPFFDTFPLVGNKKRQYRRWRKRFFQQNNPAV